MWDRLQYTFYSRFVNLDSDEFVDLVVVPNTDRVQVYKNLGNLKFQRMAPLTDFGFWMGVAVGDIDGDGDDDIFLSNAGRSIPRFLLSGDARGDQPIDIGWRLLRNDGEFIFTDITENSGVGFDEWAWGSELADFNNDGYLDLVVLENFIDWPIHKLFANPGRLLIQDTEGHFVSTNTLVDNGRNGIPLQAGAGSMGGTISQVNVENNPVNGSGQAGIFLSTEDVVTAAVTGNTLENNLLSDNGDGGIGLNVEEGTIAGNVITGNEATNNNNNGFSANTGAGVNNFQDNRSSLNTGLGYHDTGLANIYSGNLCDFNGSGGSSPEGLCTP